MMLHYFIGCLISMLICLQVVPAWAAITYVGGKTATTVGVTTEWNTTLSSLTGGSDASPASGDLVVVTYCTASQGNYNLLIRDAAAGTDYTLLGTQQYGNSTYDTSMRVAYKVMPGTPDTNVYLSETAGGTGNIQFGGTVHIAVFRGVHATPLEQAVQQGTGNTTHQVDPGGITPTTTGTYIYVSGCGAIDVGAAYTQGDLSDFQTATIADTYDSDIGGGYLAWTSGAYNPATFGAGGTVNAANSYAWTIAAFAPAAAGATCQGALTLMGMGGC